MSLWQCHICVCVCADADCKVWLCSPIELNIQTRASLQAKDWEHLVPIDPLVSALLVIQIDLVSKFSHSDRFSVSLVPL